WIEYVQKRTTQSPQRNVPAKEARITRKVDRRAETTETQVEQPKRNVSVHPQSIGPVRAPFRIAPAQIPGGTVGVEAQKGEQQRAKSDVGKSQADTAPSLPVHNVELASYRRQSIVHPSQPQDPSSIVDKAWEKESVASAAAEIEPRGGRGHRKGH